MTELTTKFWEALEDKDYEVTLQLANEVISKMPNSGYGYYLIAHHFYSQNLIKDAIENFNISIEKSTEDSIGGYSSYWLGMIYSEFSFDDTNTNVYDTEKGIEAYKRALDFCSFPENTVLQLYNYCKTKPEAGLKILARGFEIYPKNIDYKFLEIDIFYSSYQDMQKARSLCQELIDVNNPATFPAIILYLGTIDESIPFTIRDLTEDIILKLGEDPLLSTLSYEYGRVLTQNLLDPAEGEKYFISALNYGSGNEALFSIYFLVVYYLESNQDTNLISIIENLDITKLSIFLDGPRFKFLNGTRIYYDPVQFNSPVCLLEKLEDINYDTSIRFKGKLYFIKGILSYDLEYYEKAFNYFSNSCELLQLKEILDFQVVALREFIEQSRNKKQSLIKINNIVISILSSSSEFKNEFQSTYLEYLLSLLKEKKLYEQFCDLASRYILSDLDSSILFDFAYSASQCNKIEMAFELYTNYIQFFGKNSAVLNNLANIYKQRGDRETALKMYSEAVEIDPDNNIAKNNMNRINEEYQ